MARKKQTRGNCAFCNREMSRGGLSRHLASCPERGKAIAAAQSRQSDTLYHLAVRDAYDGNFWLHLEVNGRATLRDLDHYLREIWLECCGHMSQFSVGGWRGREIPMTRTVASVFAPDVELTHIYDFGSSSETLIKAVRERNGRPLTDKPIYLMARNNMPDMVCQECDTTAGWYCADCLIEQGKWITVCEEHRAKHDHDEYGGTTPLINSPRVGICGYAGPADPPY